MSYPRNNASPERIAIGPVVLIADGTVQVADVLVKVKPQDAAAAPSGGTISYEEGIVGYIPTQAETNHTSFQLIAYKADCIPAGVTVVTSAAAVAGQVVTDTASRDASKATGFLTSLGVNAPPNWINAAAVEAAALNGKGDWNIGKDGYSLTQAFPTNFASLGINASGHISRVTLVDTTTTLTNLPAITTNWLTAAGIAAGALNGKGDWNKVTPPTVATISQEIATNIADPIGDGGGYGSAGDAWIAAVDKIQDGLSTYDGSDTAGTTELLTRVVGTILAGNHTAQSGDSHAVVSSVAHGNAALKTLIDTVDNVADELNARLSAAWAGEVATATALATAKTEIDAIKIEVDKSPGTGKTHRWTNTDTAVTADVAISEAV